MKTLVGVLTVGAVFIVISAFMQTADAQQFRQPRPDDPERLRRIRECMGMEMDRKHNYPFRPAAGSTCTMRAWPTMATMDNGLAKAEFVGWAS